MEMTFPSLGHVEKDGTNYRLERIDLSCKLTRRSSSGSYRTPCEPHSPPSP
jgi:hypothetical protein